MTIIQLAEEIATNFKGAYNEEFTFLGTTRKNKYMVFESASRKLSVCMTTSEIKEIA